MGKRGPNPETEVTAEIRNLLNIMRVPHFKHFAGALGETGISDIIGTLPGRFNHRPGGYADAEKMATEIAGHPLDMSEVALTLAQEVARLRSQGRAFFCEVKYGKNKLSDEQEAFLLKHKNAGAVSFPAWSPQDLVQGLANAGFEPAKRITLQFNWREKRL